MHRRIVGWTVLALLGCGGPAGNPDGGGQGDSSTSSGELVVRVIEGPPPTRPSALTAVTATNESGASMVTMTDSSGVARITVPPGSGPWTVTAYRSGFGVVSVVGVSGALEGSLRIDPLTGLDYGSLVPISGTISGATPGNVVQIDAMDFTTVPTAMGSYTTTYYSLDGSLPLMLAAIELDRMGNAVNAVLTPMTPRTGTAQRINVTFPNPPVAPIVSTTTIAFPRTGVLDRSAQLSATYGVQRVDLSHFEDSWMLVGVMRAQTPTAEGVPLRVQSFGGDLTPHVAYVTFSSASRAHVSNIVLHDFSGSNTISLGVVRQLETMGTSIGDVSMNADADGYDTYALTIFLQGVSTPLWRLYTTNTVPVSGLRLPNVPDAWQSLSRWLTAMPQALAMAIRMHPGSPRPWETRVANSALPAYDYTVGGTYTNLLPTFR